MTIEQVTVIAEQTTLDLLLWRRFKREVIGLVEDTLSRNPGLATLGLFLPVGTVVNVKAPDPEPRGRMAAPVISLFD